jgi:SAM-dependent methyltransferase
MTFDDLMLKARGFQESRVLLTAIELDLFTAVGDGAAEEEVAARLGTDARATGMLLNALVAMGVLTKNGSVFHNTEATAEHLVAGSPRYAQPGLMHTVHLWKTWSTLTEAVRQGTAVQVPGVDARDERWTRAFISAMHMNSLGRASRMAELVGVKGVRRMLDVGGGSGAYSIAFARAGAELQSEVFDLAAVTPIAESHIREAGLESRVRTRIGDLRREELGAGYDLVLLSAICHMLSEDENRNLLRRCYRATAPGGRVVIRDFVLEENRAAPKQAALFALNMLVGTKGGSTYTESEYRRWLEEAGYAQVERLEGDGDIMTARRPA